MFELKYYFRRTKLILLAYFVIQVLLVGFCWWYFYITPSYINSMEYWDQAYMTFSVLQFVVHPVFAILIIRRLELKFVKMLQGRTYLYPILTIVILSASMMFFLYFLKEAIDTNYIFSGDHLDLLFFDTYVNHFRREFIAMGLNSFMINLVSVAVAYLGYYSKHRIFISVYIILLIFGVLFIETLTIRIYGDLTDNGMFISILYISLYYVSPLLVLGYSLRRVDL